VSKYTQTSTMSQITRSEPQELAQALERIEAEVRAGLEHGFFQLEVACEVVQRGKRRLTVKGGKSHLFVISGENCP